MQSKTTLQSSFSSEQENVRGSVMIEMALLLPLLILFSLNTFDIGKLLINYMDAVHIVREGVRMGGSIPGLENGSYEDQGGNCYLSPMTNPPVSCPVNLNHRRLQQSIKKIIASSANDFKGNPSEIVIFTKYDPTVTEQSVTVRLEFKYQGLLKPFDLINVNTSAVGPFL